MLILAAGDKVRITQHAFDNDEYSIAVIATKGSIGKVLSYSEYCDYIQKIGAGYSKEYFLFVQQEMNEGRCYPIRFVKVVMPPKDFYDEWEGSKPVYMGCKARRVCLLGVKFLEKQRTC